MVKMLEQDYYTVAEAAAALGVSHSTQKGRVRNGPRRLRLN